jgi:hypothetical protein
LAISVIAAGWVLLAVLDTEKEIAPDIAANGVVEDGPPLARELTSYSWREVSRPANLSPHIWMFFPKMTLIRDNATPGGTYSEGRMFSPARQGWTLDGDRLTIIGSGSSFGGDDEYREEFVVDHLPANRLRLTGPTTGVTELEAVPRVKFRIRRIEGYVARTGLLIIVLSSLAVCQMWRGRSRLSTFLRAWGTTVVVGVILAVVDALLPYSRGYSMFDIPVLVAGLVAGAVLGLIVVGPIHTFLLARRPTNPPG